MSIGVSKKQKELNKDSPGSPLTPTEYIQQGPTKTIQQVTKEFKGYTDNKPKNKIELLG